MPASIQSNVRAKSLFSIKFSRDSLPSFGNGVGAQVSTPRTAARAYAGGFGGQRRVGFEFTLSCLVRRDAHSQELQVPCVAPRPRWPRLARTPQATPTTWTTLAAHPASGEVPALVTLGELQHWLRTSPMDDAEEREASAYWAVCQAQQRREQRLRDTFRRQSEAMADAEAAAAECGAYSAATSERQVPGWAHAANVLTQIGLTKETTAAAARRDAAGCRLGGAAEAGRAGAWGAKLTAEALDTWRGWSGPSPQAVPVGRPVAQEKNLGPGRAYAACLGEMIAVAARQPEALLPAPGARHQLTVTLRVGPDDAPAATGPTHVPDPERAVLQRWDVVLASVDLDEGGPAQALHLARTPA